MNVIVDRASKQSGQNLIVCFILTLNLFGGAVAKLSRALLNIEKINEKPGRSQVSPPGLGKLKKTQFVQFYVQSHVWCFLS